MPLHLQHLRPNPDPPVPTASFMRKLNQNPGRCRFFQSAAIFAGLLVVSASVVANDVPDVTGTAEDRKDGSHPAVVFPEKHRNLLQNFCFDCHDSATRKGQVDLENIPFELNSIEAAERWQAVQSAELQSLSQSVSSKSQVRKRRPTHQIQNREARPRRR